MAKVKYYTSGIVAFNNLITKDVYRGDVATSFSITLTFDEVERDKLHELGVKTKAYKDVFQNKFSTRYDMSDKIVFGVEGLDKEECVPFDLPELSYGARVRVMFTLGDDHPVYGFGTRLERMRVFEVGSGGDDGNDEF